MDHPVDQRKELDMKRVRHTIAIGLLLCLVGWAGIARSADAGAAATSKTAGSTPAPSPAVADVAIDKRGRALVISYSDGTLAKIPAKRGQAFTHIMETSQDRRWAVVEWTDPETLGGSMGGRIETMTALVSVDQRRVIDPVDLGLGHLLSFGFERRGKAEVLQYAVAGKKTARTIALDALDALIKKSPGKKR
jgi:hypothetical protein